MLKGQLFFKMHGCYTFFFILSFFLSAAELKDDAIIDDIISLVDGGKIDFSVKIKEMLLRRSKMVDVEDYIQWANSLVDAPVVIQQRVSTTSSKLWLLRFESFCSKVEARLQVYHELSGIFFILSFFRCLLVMDISKGFRTLEKSVMHRLFSSTAFSNTYTCSG